MRISLPSGFVRSARAVPPVLLTAWVLLFLSPAAVQAQSAETPSTTNEAVSGGTSGDAAVAADAETGGATKDTDETDEGRQAEPPEDRSFFATVTVTATGTETDAFEIATPVTVIGSDEIERQAPNNAADLLRNQTGVDVNGVGPNQARPIIRGQRGLRVLFLENGLRLNNPRRQTDFGEISGLVDLDAVERVEVVRGPASVLYGSDAIGGVLNLVTRIPQLTDGHHLTGSVSLRAGTADEQRRAQASVSQRTNRFAFGLGGAIRNTSDYEAPTGRFGNIKLDDEVTVLDSSVDDDSLSGFLGFWPSDSHSLALRFNRYRAGQTGFGFVDPTLIGEDDSFRIRILYPFQDFDRLSLQWLGSAVDSVLADSIDAQVYYQSNERRLVNQIEINIGPIFPGAPDSGVSADTNNFTDLDTVGLRTEVVKLAGPNHLVTYGLDYTSVDSFNTDSSVTTTTIRFPFPPFAVEDVSTDDVPNAPNAENTDWGVFVQDEIFAGDRLKLTLGARYQRVDTSAKPTEGFDTAGLDFSDDKVVGAVNFLYRLKPYLHLVGGWGTAFRTPNIIERLFNGLTPEGAGYQILNPDLTSEESENYDLGLKYQRRNAYMEVNYFRNEITDGIIQAFLTPEEIAALPADVQQEIDQAGVQAVVQQRNVDRLRYEGFEGTLGYRSTNGWVFGANYTHLSARRVGQSAVPVEDLFSTKINGWVRWQPPAGRFWVEYRVRHNGEEDARFDPGEPPPLVGETLPAFTVHTLAAGARLFEIGRQEHSLSLVVDNLTDELYAEFSNASFFRPAPKRNLVATYRVRF
ncbi:MAG: TonB-dependent receptor [Acidobacteria bacterium]|nr:TonB-dependent receptor [Acidobacteriota bacterium]